MAIYHYSESNVSRSQGRSACAAAAYITASSVSDVRQGMVFNYANKPDVVISFTYVPEDAPEWARNTQDLWNSAAEFEDKLIEDRFKGNNKDLEKNERSLAARDMAKASAIEAHMIVMALPKEFTLSQSEETVKAFLEGYLKPRNLCATVALHDDEGNPHAHVLVAPRSLEEGGWHRLKCRDFNSRDALKERRALWAQVVNEKARAWDMDVQIDHRSYQAQGLHIMPTRHEGWFARDTLKDASRIVQENAQIRARNIEILFENPSDILKLVSSRRPVLTRKEIISEIFKRVGGDDTLWHLLREKVERLTFEKDGQIQERLSLVASMNQANANVHPGFTTQEKEITASQYLERAVSQEHFLPVGQNVRGERVYTSRQILDQEQHFGESVAVLAGRTGYGVDGKILRASAASYALKRGFSLGEEQVLALGALCDERGLGVIEGRAGTGKTTVLEVLKDTYTAQGYRLMGGAFQGRTAEHLQSDTGIASYTLDMYCKRWDSIDKTRTALEEGASQGKSAACLQKTLGALEPFELTDRTVFVVDEAFTAPAHLLHALVRRAASKGAKVILAGDARQTLAFTSGDFGRAVTNQVGSVTLEDIRRQKVDWQRAASLDLSRHSLWEGFHAYDERGHIHALGRQEEAVERLATDYLAHIRCDATGGRLCETALLAYRQESVSALNALVVAGLRASGHLGKEILVSGAYGELQTRAQELIKSPERVDALQDIEKQMAQVRQGRIFYEGQRIIFTQNDHTGAYVKNTDPRDARQGVRNGTQGILLGQDDHGYARARLDDGRTVSFHTLEGPSRGKEFVETGYAMSVHKSQGLTKDHTFALFEESNANLLYVMGTRHRYGFEGYVDTSKHKTFKAFAVHCERSEYRPLVQDYRIDPSHQDSFNRVASYVELSYDLSQTLSTIGELQEGQGLSTQSLRAAVDGTRTLLADGGGVLENKKKTLDTFWEKYHALKAARGLVAKDMVEDGLEKHAVFLAQAGVRETVIQVEAGVKTRSLTALECLARGRANTYALSCQEARSLWQQITQGDRALHGHDLKAHPLYPAYHEKKLARDQGAFEIVSQGNIALFKPFLRESGVSIKGLEAHNAAHLHMCTQKALQELHPQMTQHLQAYLQDRGLSFQSALSQEQVTHARARRDASAYRVVEALERDHGSLLDVFVSAKAQISLVHHAARHEARLFAARYQNAQTVEEKGLAAQSILAYAKVGDILKENNMNKDHLVFEAALSRAVQEGQLPREALQEKTFTCLESWKEADKARRAMYNAAFKARDKSALCAGDTPRLVVDHEIVSRFERDSRALLHLVGPGLSPHMKHTPVFGLLEKTAMRGVKGRIATTEVRAQRTHTRLSPQEFEGFLHSVTRATDIGALAVHVLASQGLDLNKAMSKENNLRFGAKGSVSVNTSGPKAGQWYSFEEGTGGNALSFVKHFQGCSFKGALETMRPYVSSNAGALLDEFLDNTLENVLEKTTSRPITPPERSKEAYLCASKLASVHHLVSLSVPITNTPAQTYLAKRGIHDTQGADLAYLKPGTRFIYDGRERHVLHGGMLAIARDHDDLLSAVQITYFDKEGARATFQNGQKIPKITYGQPKGAFVTLKDTKRGPLYVSEGVETGLSVASAGVYGTFKAALGIHNMGNIHAPQDRTLVLVADWDGHGARSHEILEGRARMLEETLGQKPLLIWPTQEGDQKRDFNDVLLSKGSNAVAQTVFDQHRVLNVSLACQVFDTSKAPLDHLHDVFKAAQKDKSILLTHKEHIETTAHGAYAHKDVRDTLARHADDGFCKFITEHFDAHEKAHDMATHATLDRYLHLSQEHERAVAQNTHEQRVHIEICLEEMAHRISQNPDVMDHLEAVHGAHTVQGLQQYAQKHQNYLTQQQQHTHTFEMGL